MPSWKLICPKCQTEVRLKPEEILVECGQMTGNCTCSQCGTAISGQQEYWQFLGLLENPIGPEFNE